MNKKFIQFFKIRVLQNKTAGSRRATKTNSEKHKQGPYKTNSAKWMKKIVMDGKTWQDPRWQGHGEWNGNRHLLYPKAMGLPGTHRPWPK